MDYKELSAPQLVSEWDTPTDFKERDKLVSAILASERATREAWPSAAVAKREEMAGLYPDPADPHFAARLYAKREFHEARAVVAGVAEGVIDPCTSKAAEAVFELTPVQQIVSRFMHPMTPYQGMLLFHGVGVGKTCSAVTIAEQFLESAPHKKVIVLAPQALKENFKRTVFDLSKLKWSAADKRWKINQCTGTSYLERLGLLENPDLHTVTYRIEEDRRNRYTVTGYQAFANWVDATLKKSVPVGLTDPEARLVAENEVLRRLFSDHLIIVDEAHNLRDLTAGDVDKQAVVGEANENQGGKSLNPFLKRIVLNAEGLRLVLMTATPMYNSAPEIVLLLNYLIMNDSKKEQSKLLLSTDMFNKDGSLKPGKSQQRLEDAARAYVSYMRGENPYTFPLRMKPLAAADAPAEMWPAISATKNPIVLTDEDKAALNALPLVFTEPVAGSPVELQLRGATSRGTVDAETPADAMLDLRMQMANITYPNTMFGTGGWDSYFSRSFITGTGHKLRVFTPKKDFNIDSVFVGEGLRTHAPKINKIIESIKSARGICFVYSRYIKSGALPLATALERAGFQRRLADGRIAPLLKGVAAVPAVCAVCGSVSAGHSAEHTFKPACYVLLTSEDDISPNFAGLVRQATTWSDEDGPLGSNVKIVIGSQVASEGLDLKCIREMHILDSWYHLNRTDQIIGRAIRYCSHSALRAVEKRQGLDAMTLNNCLIYMHATRVPETEAGPAFETADMYAYRIAIGKAQMVGKVQRLLKKNAWDCNLELEAITFVGLPPKKQIDAQGAERKSLNDDGTEMDGYDINDQDYTTYCDYQVCKHQCVETIVEAGLHLDTSTFDITDARRLVLAKQDIVRGLFTDNVMVPETTIKDLFGDMPWELASEALMELIDGRRFRLTRPDGVEGFLIKKAGYLVFQPSGVTDTDIPMTLRYARGFQLQRHFMTPHMPVWGRAEEAGPASVPAAKKTEVGSGPGPGPGPSSAILEKWTEWLTFVNSGGKEKLPSTLSSTQRIWSWLLDHYAAIPELRGVALQWWFDNIISFEEQKALLEVAITGAGPVVDSLRSILDPNILRTKSTVAYRLFNPVNASVELFCTQPQANTFKACTSSVATTVDKMLGNTPVKYITPDAETGPYFGFITTKSKKLVFKTLDTKSTKTLGAECGNASNLGDHHLRVLAFHEAGRGNAELAPLMLEDTDESWDEKGAKARMVSMKPAHMKDITHQPLCLYIEFLARLFDARRVNGKRWFLNAIVASQSGLKGRA